MQLKALSTYLDDYLASESFRDAGLNGLQVEGRAEVKKLGTGVSASLKTIELAIESGCDALLVHHGIFWKGDCYRVDGIKRRKLALLLDSGMSLFSYHIPLDAHQELGNNWKAARDMGWGNLEPFGLVDGKCIGVRGTFCRQGVQQFVEGLESYYGHPAHTALWGKEQVASAALVSGGAHKMIREAVDVGVDCYITGSFDEPIWHIAQEEGIHFAALGHANTETVGPKALGIHLAEAHGLDVEFLDLPNPF